MIFMWAAKIWLLMIVFIKAKKINLVGMFGPVVWWRLNIICFAKSFGKFWPKTNLIWESEKLNGLSLGLCKLEN